MVSPEASRGSRWSLGRLPRLVRHIIRDWLRRDSRTGTHPARRNLPVLTSSSPSGGIPTTTSARAAVEVRGSLAGEPRRLPAESPHALRRYSLPRSLLH